jgi:negative regulator of sigma E activity
MFAYKKREVSLPESSNDASWNVELELFSDSLSDFSLSLNPQDESRLHGVTP